MKRTRFGIIGAGLWGKIHAGVYSTHHKAELVAVCDLNAERAKEMARDFGASRVYSDYQELTTDPEVDAVAIVTPDFAHCDPIVAAARAGKHIIVEKPLATTQEDCARIAEAVNTAGVSLMVDFHCRWCPPIAVARSDIEKGTLGKLISGYLRLNDTLNVPTQMLSWASRSSILWFLGSHTVDTLRYLFADEVVRVYSLSRSEVLKEKGVNVPDIYQAVLEFQSGVIATIENNWIVPNSNPCFNDFKINVLGSKGMVNMDLSHNQMIERFLETSSDHPDILDGPLVQGKHVGLAYESIRDFVESVTDGDPVKVTLEDGIKVTQVLLAIMKSAETRQPVNVNY